MVSLTLQKKMVHLVHHADKFLVSAGGLKSTHTGNTRGPPGAWNCNPDDLIW